jgi:Flp pilus assembly protein TadD
MKPGSSREVDPARSFRFAYGVLTALLLLRFLPLIAGTVWFWGVGSLTLLPSSYLAVYAIFVAISLALPWISRASDWGEALSSDLANRFFEGRAAAFRRLGLVALAGIIFVLLRMPTHFLGDGYQFLVNLGSDTGHWVKWSEGGAMLTIMGVRSLFGPASADTALRAFQVVSIFSGMVTIWFYILIAREISANPIKQFLTFATLLGSSGILLFYGYVESYPVMWGVVAGFFYFSIRYANEGKGIVPALICLGIATFLHLQNAMYFPAVGYLLLSRGAGLQLFRKYRALIIGTGVLAAVAVLGIFFRKYFSDLAVEVIFLYPFGGKPASPGYGIISARHLADIVNLFLLVFPLGMMVASLAQWDSARRLKERNTVYLGLLAIGGVLFLLLIDPGLSMPRDWDLFSSCWLAPMLLLLHLVPDTRTATVRRLLPSVVVALIALVMPWLLVNLDEDRSVAEIKQIINDNPDKSLGSMTILGSYYQERGEFRQVDSVNKVMERTYLDFYRWQKAFQLLQQGNGAEANRLVAQTRPDKFSKDYQSVTAGYFLKVGQPDSALAHAEAARQLQPYVDQTYGLLAYAYMLKGKQMEALEALRHGYRLNSHNLEVIRGLALLHCGMGKFDSTLAYAERYHQVDSADAAYHYMLAKAYLGKREGERAYQEASLYIQLGRNSARYQQNAQELEKLFSEPKPAR